MIAVAYILGAAVWVVAGMLFALILKQLYKQSVSGRPGDRG